MFSKVSASGVATTFGGGATGVRERPFHLEIPAGTMEEGAKYKFRLTASTAAQTASVSTILETMALPIVPNCSVSKKHTQVSAKRWALGCVNSPSAA